MLIDSQLVFQSSSCDSDISVQSLESNKRKSYRFIHSQKNRTLSHPILPQPSIEDEKLHLQTCTQEFSSDFVHNLPKSEIDHHSENYNFVVCTDTQLGMTNMNRDWDIELNNTRQAVQLINSLHPRPLFCMCCGDLADMEYSFHETDSKFSKEECDEIQDKQNRDFKSVWMDLDDSIPLVCLCGNHDVGNRPTRNSINKFRSAFGDEYLAFWSNGCYNIVLNNVLFVDPSQAFDMFEEQLEWLESKLKYATLHKADQIFVFAHHPWFLYNDDEEDEDLLGVIPFPKEWATPTENAGFPEKYFNIKRKYRDIVLQMFKKYGVKASFSGHFHQNVISKTSWGMDMIITAPLSVVFEATGKPKQSEEDSIGIRVVEVGKKSFTHKFVPLKHASPKSPIESNQPPKTIEINLCD